MRGPERDERPGPGTSREDRRALSEQLPDALDMMARSLSAGHALTSAFKLVAGEMPSPIIA